MSQARFVRAISEKAVQFKINRMPGTQAVGNPQPTTGTMQGHYELDLFAAPLNTYNPNPLGGFTEIQLLEYRQIYK